MKKVISFVLTIALVFCSFGYVLSVSGKKFTRQEEQAVYNNPMNKIHFYFSADNEFVSSEKQQYTSLEKKQYLFIKDEEDLSDAIRNTNQILPSEEEIQITVEFQSGINHCSEYKSCLESFTKAKSIEEVHAARKKLALFSKQYHQDLNQKNTLRLSAFQPKSIIPIDYSPFIVMRIKVGQLNEDALKTIVQDPSVVNISVAPIQQATDDALWTRVLKEINAYATVVTGVYTGAGVNIGIIESGVCDTNNSALQNVNITIDPNHNNQSDHATAVTSIIARLAPDANYYCSSNKSGGIAWMIENNCDIVNCSFGHNPSYQPSGSNTYVYDPSLATYRFDVDGVYDYQAWIHNITLVVSAGNKSSDNTVPSYNPFGHITSPGLAYHAITVGGLDCRLSGLQYQLTHCGNASYVTEQSRVKPDISSVFTVKFSALDNESHSGTSISAPQVTGCIATQMEKRPASAGMPQEIKSTILSSATKTADYNANLGYFDTREGAGCINMEGMHAINNFVDIFILPNFNSAPNSIIHNQTVSLKKNQNFQAALAWDARVEGATQSIHNTDYDLRLYNSSGVLVCQSALGSFSNSELIRYKVPATGTYTIAVYQNGEVQTYGDTLSLTFKN